MTFATGAKWELMWKTFLIGPAAPGNCYRLSVRPSVCPSITLNGRQILKFGRKKKLLKGSQLCFPLICLIGLIISPVLISPVVISPVIKAEHSLAKQTQEVMKALKEGKNKTTEIVTSCVDCLQSD